MLLRAWANFSDCGFSRRVFLFRQEFFFSQSYRFFPSFCQALAEDCVTTPTKKKKKLRVRLWLELFWGASSISTTIMRLVSANQGGHLFYLGLLGLESGHWAAY